MKADIKKKKWTDDEIKALKKYALDNEKMLLKIFYKNIYEGKHIYRKKDGFFKDLGQILKRSSSECKSKFQKYEREIYTEFLGVPEMHYLLLKYIREKKMDNKKNSLRILNNYENKNTYFSFLQKLIKTNVDEFGFDLVLLKSIFHV